MSRKFDLGFIAIIAMIIAFALVMGVAGAEAIKQENRLLQREVVLQAEPGHHLFACKGEELYLECLNMLRVEGYSIVDIEILDGTIKKSYMVTYSVP